MMKLTQARGVKLEEHIIIGCQYAWMYKKLNEHSIIDDFHLVHDQPYIGPYICSALCCGCGLSNPCRPCFHRYVQSIIYSAITEVVPKFTICFDYGYIEIVFSVSHWLAVCVCVYFCVCIYAGRHEHCMH